MIQLRVMLTEVLPYLTVIDKEHGLRLNRAKEFKFARIILVNLYNRELS